MEDEEIIAQYHREQQQIQVVRQYFEGITNRDWDSLEELVRAGHLSHTKEQFTRAQEGLGLSDDWVSLREAEYQAYDRFSQRSLALLEKHGLEAPSPSKVADPGNAQHVTIEDHLKILQEHRDSGGTTFTSSLLIQKVKIKQITSTGNRVLCHLITTTKDPLTGRDLTSACHSTHYFEDGIMTGFIYIPHLLGNLIQLGKLVGSEVSSGNISGYLNNLYELGIIERDA